MFAITANLYVFESAGVNDGGDFFICKIHVNSPYSFALRKRSALVITDTELKLIAVAAIIGDNKMPKTGYKIPAATGTPAEL